MEKYDLVVIGGGPAGYAGAMRAIDFGKKVLLIEKNKIGGAGIYNGALWSKTMWEYSQKISAIRSEIPDFDVKFSELQKTTDAAVFERKFQMNCHIKLLKSEAKKQLLFYEKGYGEIVSEHEVRVMKEDHHHHDDFHSDPHQPVDPISEKTVYAEHILIATGSRPRKLDNIAIDEHIIMTSDGLSNLTDFPKSMVILGAGVIGCEFATIFSNLGKTKVFLIDKAPRILPFEDEDISAMVTSNLEQNGVVIHKNSSLVRMEIKDGEVEYELCGENGKKEILRVEKALVSVGRVPNVENIGLEKVGVKLNDRGAIEDSDTQTNIENIWVAGDLTSEMALVNIAEREARHAVVRMFGPPIKPLTYRNISTIMFLNPEVAAVGMSEQECRKKGISIKVAKVDYSMLARPIAMRKTNGFFKMIVTNDSNMRVLGMRAVGEHASSAIEAVALVIYMNKGIDELGHMLHPHPSITEGIQECARMLLGKSIYKSSMFKDKLQCYTCVDNVCTPLENL